VPRPSLQTVLRQEQMVSDGVNLTDDTDH
jgi:hypothetical protein